jgi:hypothetical protein
VKLKRVVTLGYPASGLPDDLRGDLIDTDRVNAMVEEEPGEGETTDIEWEVVVQRWVDGDLVPASMDDVPASLLETTS